MLTHIQKRKNIIAHDRFLTKLQHCVSDTMRPLIFLLKELQLGKAIAKNKAVTALQTALCFTGNAFATLSVERWSILQQPNLQLTPSADKEFENNGKLFGKRAKERIDAIQSRSKSSSIFFFRLGDPPPHLQQVQGPSGSWKRRNKLLQPIWQTKKFKVGQDQPSAGGEVLPKVKQPQIKGSTWAGYKKFPTPFLSLLPQTLTPIRP